MEVVEAYKIEDRLSNHAIGISYVDIKELSKKKMLQGAMRVLLEKGYVEQQFILRFIWSERPSEGDMTIIRLVVLVYEDNK